MLAQPPTEPVLRAAYSPLESLTLPGDVLAAAVFGTGARAPQDPRCLRIALEPLGGTDVGEVWRGRGQTQAGAVGLVRYVSDGDYLAGWIDVDEADLGGLVEAAEAAYSELLGFHATSSYRYIWRMWNFVTAINEGSGDDERYKLFCLGRALGFATSHATSTGIGYPAATAVGKPQGPRTLQVCWIAGREPGVALENPRQVSAYNYPRQYGPAAPAFSRAMLLPGALLMVSGTASIVGHASMHAGDSITQLHETLDNLDALLRHALGAGKLRSARLGADSLLKVYLRRAADAPVIARGVRERLGDEVPLLMLAADICRSELLLEIEAVIPC